MDWLEKKCHSIRVRSGSSYIFWLFRKWCWTGLFFFFSFSLLTLLIGHGCEIRCSWWIHDHVLSDPFEFQFVSRILSLLWQWSSWKWRSMWHWTYSYDMWWILSTHYDHDDNYYRRRDRAANSANKWCHVSWFIDSICGVYLSMLLCMCICSFC